MKKNRKEVGDLVLLFRGGLVFWIGVAVEKLSCYIKSINKTTITTVRIRPFFKVSFKKSFMTKIIAKGGKKCQILMM